MDKFQKIIIAFVFVCLTVILCCLLGGCVSRGNANDVDGTIIEYQREIDRLEEELRNRDRTIEDAIREIGTITSRSESMEGTVDEVIRLFDEYQRRVDKMLWEYERIRGQAESTTRETEFAD